MSGVPVHSPLLAVRVPPSRVSPETAGGAVFAGGSACTAALAPEVAVAEPPPFRAVTSTTTAWPTSAAVAV
jgi:hypothetical protein